MSSQNRIALILVATVALSVVAIVFSRSASASDEERAELNVSCGASQRAVVQQTSAGGSPRVTIHCVDAADGQPASPVPHDVAGPVPAAHHVAAAPAMYYAASSPVTYQTVPGIVTHAPVWAPAAPPAAERIHPPAPVHVPQVATALAARPVVERKSSWKKRAVVIGGASGAGAGIGALIGGRKGALIGAAIGGGGAAVVDQVRHR